MAGTIQPWWHHIGAYHEDRRQYSTAAPLFQWHEKHHEFLFDRKPVAAVGVVWSQRSGDFFGRDNAHELCFLPHFGIVQALIRKRIPYMPVHVDDIAKYADDLDVLVLPNLGAMTDAQCAAVRDFTAKGKGVLATGDTSRCDEWGNVRQDFGLADLFGVHATGPCPTPSAKVDKDWGEFSNHTYLRIYPELRARVDGPRIGNEPEITKERHEVLKGFESTDLLPFGGRLTPVTLDEGVEGMLAQVPAFPIYPPETSWVREEADASKPALALRTLSSGARVAYCAGSFDYCFGRDNLPDHGDLLANIIEWLAPHGFPVRVTGAGLLDCRLFHQPGRMVLHIVNLTNPGAWKTPVHELIPAGPFTVEVKLNKDVAGQRVRFLVSGASSDVEAREGRVSVQVPSILDHEVLVLE
jgi:hypothetical protein